jgi:orotate phosphoribosyltransferase
VVGIVVALDRIEKEYEIPVLSILNLNDIIGGLKGLGSEEDIRRLEEYRVKYKATD